MDATTTGTQWAVGWSIGCACATRHAANAQLVRPGCPSTMLRLRDTLNALSGVSRTYPGRLQLCARLLWLAAATGECPQHTCMGTHTQECPSAQTQQPMFEGGICQVAVRLGGLQLLKCTFCQETRSPPTAAHHPPVTPSPHRWPHKLLLDKTVLLDTSAALIIVPICAAWLKTWTT
jgi:hypothetical protein